jgi:hypothetical protein
MEGKGSESIPLFITNYHVVNDAKRGLIEVAKRKDDKPDKGRRVRVELDGELLNRHSDEEHDLVALPIAPLLNQLESAGEPVFFRSIAPELVPDANVLEDLAALEEITFIGYPSGLYDQRNVTPLIRRGITATPVWNDFEGQPAFLIDAGVFPGSSGSPVFILNQGSYASSRGIVIGNRLLFLGVLTHAILRKEKAKPEVFLGLGKVIKSSKVIEFAKNVAKKVLSPA